MVSGLVETEIIVSFLKVAIVSHLELAYCFLPGDGPLFPQTPSPSSSAGCLCHQASSEIKKSFVCVCVCVCEKPNRRKRGEGQEGLKP